MEVISLGVGILLGAVGCLLAIKFKLGNIQTLGKEILEKVEHEIEHKKNAFELEQKEKSFAHQRILDERLHAIQLKIAKEEERLVLKESTLALQATSLEKKYSELEKKDSQLRTKITKVEEDEKNLLRLQDTVIDELEKIATFTASEAKDLLLDRIEKHVSHDMARLTMRIKTEAVEHADQEASRIIATALQRLALPCSFETLVTTVSLPNEEMKGRIVGREGRNIRVLEHLTGVNFLIDDTPNTIVISGFDPIRKHIAKTALAELILDGRIHPTRIEEAVDKARSLIQKKIKERGLDAAMRAGASDLHPEILALLGKLYFCTSLGQNVLEHSIEVSYIMGFFAAELGLNCALAKRIGLLHDMGKGVSHEYEGSHALIGRDFALRYGECEEVANGIGCHHDEIPPQTLEGSLCCAADALSGGRPGARSEAVEHYIKRLRKLEMLSCQFEGVVKAYALQAGREIRVLVEPTLIDDSQTINLARDLAHRIAQEISFPGKIKVTVIREKRATEYAT